MHRRRALSSFSTTIVMHPFGGTPICPRCSKAVYAAEQVMGPGRKLYHKPCLACMSCKKRLDSYTLLEHDEQPYCKACHLKNFGTRNLRHANLPVASPPSPTSPPSTTTTTATRRMSIGSDLPRLRANRSLASSPVTSNFPRGSSPQQHSDSTNNNIGNSTAPNYRRGSWGSARGSVTPPEEDEVRKALTLEDGDVMDAATTSTSGSSPKDKPLDGMHYADDTVTAEPSSPPSLAQSQSTTTTTTTQLSNTGRPGIGTLPRTIPLSARHRPSSSLNSLSSLGSIPQEKHEEESEGAHAQGQGQGQAPDDDDDASARRVQTEADDHDVTPNLPPPPSLPRRPSPTSPSALARHYTGSYTGSYTGAGSSSSARMLKPTATGTRYGMALGGSTVDALPIQMTGSGSGSGIGSGMGTGTGTGMGIGMSSGMNSPRRQWGAGAGASTPKCPRCEKSVYFAEQVKAVGKTFHKGCLRCAMCGTTLDSNRLRDHDGDPYCVRCYGKNYGPQGSGYALLGKAGG